VARTTVVKLIDDLDGSEAVVTVNFSFREESYEIDLSESNAEHFDSVLRPYVDHARRVKRSTLPTKRKSSASGLSKEELAGVRAWALAQGLQVSAAGRIATSIIEKYRQAHA
jgi:hypothetical protein